MASKNDATDAPWMGAMGQPEFRGVDQAVADAAGRPTMHFVPVKSLECQDLQSLHRASKIARAIRARKV
jgi:hypothetical protein